MHVNNEIVVLPSPSKQRKLLTIFFLAVGNTLSPYITAPFIGAGFSFILMVILEVIIGVYAYTSLYRKKNTTPIKSFTKSLPFFILVLLIQALRLNHHNGPIVNFFFSLSDMPSIVFLVIISPFCEEVFYRGCLFDALCSLCDAIGAGTGKIVPSLTTSLIFSLMHTQFTSISDYGFVFIISLILIRVRVITKGLHIPIILHSFVNIIFVVTLTK
ncbi:lysostaphin resistance A-like protein [Buttiauxella noackiae]|uniref:CPBP family intramembrane glutamic endopeptidase n=1 Tax=Buttiauxella noackiae TaxID=82992 RepID=UPI0035A613CB